MVEKKRMKKMKFFIELKGCMVECKITDNKNCEPSIVDIFKIVGLEELIPQLKKFYRLFGETQISEFLKWIAYTCDISLDESRRRFKRYVIIDGGCRISVNSHDFEQVSESFDMLRLYVTNIDETFEYSTDEIIRMFNDEGFQEHFNMPVISNYCHGLNIPFNQLTPVEGLIEFNTSQRFFSKYSKN